MPMSFPGERACSDAALPVPATLPSTDSEQFSAAPKTSPALCAKLILLETVRASRRRLVPRCERCERMPGTPRIRRREFVTLLGASAVWPATTRAQQTATPVIGFLGGSSLAERRPLLAGFRQALAEAGYVQGQNVAIEYRCRSGANFQSPVASSATAPASPRRIVKSAFTPPRFSLAQSRPTCRSCSRQHSSW